jgi:hypothetical protein
MTSADEHDANKSQDDQTVDILVPKWVTPEHRAEIKRQTQALLTNILKEKSPNIIASDGDKPPHPK